MNWRWIVAALSAVGIVGWLTGRRGGFYFFSGPPRVSVATDRLLLIGDSLAVGLGPGMSRTAKAAGIPFDYTAVSGSRIGQWANSSQLKLELTTFKPTVVLVCLGTNDVYANDYPEAAVRKLLTVIGDRKVYWIGMPSLPKDISSVMSAIFQRVSGLDYFHSEQLDIPRQPDGVHPTGEGYSVWNRAIWEWLVTHYR